MATKYLAISMATLIERASTSFYVVESGTVANTSASALAPSCVNAIESQVDCDEYLQLQASADVYGADNTTQAIVCTTGCASSLNSYLSNVESSCAEQPLPWEDMPHAYFGKVLQATYNMTCLQDSHTGAYCTRKLINLVSTCEDERI